MFVVTIDITSSYESFRSNSPVSIAMKHVSRFNDTSESDVSSKVYENTSGLIFQYTQLGPMGSERKGGTSTGRVRIAMSDFAARH